MADDVPPVPGNDAARSGTGGPRPGRPAGQQAPSRDSRSSNKNLDEPRQPEFITLPTKGDAKWATARTYKATIAAVTITAAASIVAAVVIALTIGLLGTPAQRPTRSPTASPSHPPPPSVVTVLMTEEGAATTTRNLAIVGRIYAPGAFVRDAACRSPGHSVTWRGLVQIRARYRALASFAFLRHEFPRVHFIPDNSRAVRATATAQTAGRIRPSRTSPAGRYMRGGEVWTFARISGRWLVTSFTYDVCNPASGGR